MKAVTLVTALLLSITLLEAHVRGSVAQDDLLESDSLDHDPTATPVGDGD